MTIYVQVHSKVYLYSVGYAYWWWPVLAETRKGKLLYCPVKLCYTWTLLPIHVLRSITAQHVSYADILYYRYWTCVKRYSSLSSSNFLCLLLYACYYFWCIKKSSFHKIVAQNIFVRHTFICSREVNEKMGFTLRNFAVRTHFLEHVASVNHGRAACSTIKSYSLHEQEVDTNKVS
jgi:hypothetical protein